jgi:glycerophosphoryl diester phosphodiesterase
MKTEATTPKTPARRAVSAALVTAGAGLLALFALAAQGCKPAACDAARSAPVSDWNVTDHVALADFVVQAHRGAGDLAEEGTLESFKLGWSLGTIPEADIRETRDGVIVSFHDGNFERLIKGADEKLKKSSVEKSTWEFLRTLDVGAWKGEAFAGRRAAKMSGIFAYMAANPGLRLYMDIKKVDLAKLAAQAGDAGVGSRVIVASRNPDFLVEWKKLAPESGTLLWMPQKSDEVMELVNKLVENGKIKAVTSVQLHVHPNPNYKNHNPAFDYNTGWKNNAPDAGADEPFNHSREFIIKFGARLRELGIPYQAFVYTRDPSAYGALMDLGVASFATDRPDVAMNEVKAYYARHGKK